MQKITVLIVTLCALFLLVGLLPVHGETEIYSSVLRLHVLANSDSEEDQALKLQVRDAVLAVSEPFLSDCTTREEASLAVEQNKASLEQAARDAIRAAGRDDGVRIELGEEEYPTRAYESCCFPAGTYLSLRVIIGEGAGQNWWCVLFPPMCLSAASATQAEDAFIAVGLTGEQYRVITETDQPAYSVRFRILEVVEQALR